MDLNHFGKSQQICTFNFAKKKKERKTKEQEEKKGKRHITKLYPISSREIMILSISSCLLRHLIYENLIKTQRCSMIAEL